MLYSSPDYYIQAVFAGLLPRLEIGPRANRAGFMLNKVALGQRFSKSISGVAQNTVAKSLYKIHRKP